MATEPVEAPERIAFLRKRPLAPAYRAGAFRTAARVLAALPAGEIAEWARAGAHAAPPGAGPKTAQVVRESLTGDLPGYLRTLEGDTGESTTEAGSRLRDQCAGTALCARTGPTAAGPIEETGRTAATLGHAWAALRHDSPGPQGPAPCPRNGCANRRARAAATGLDQGR
ncbi:hypothetical protein AB0D59_29325 [Streptomyces sp. NPDC048417]|uniref:hypothetical protein n=1 Tax=Streptomyces sp. NPDC048417 TaxID=3155387 RepID=UPI003442D529